VWVGTSDKSEVEDFKDLFLKGRGKIFSTAYEILSYPGHFPLELITSSISKRLNFCSSCFAALHIEFGWYMLFT